jgi:hypothetical protein
MRNFEQAANHQEPSIHEGYSPIHGFLGHKPCATCQMISAKTGE